MSVLDFLLDDRRFDDLVEAAQSRLPALAPNWTDYNLHDPGITLIELMAWLGEAQIYSLGRVRRDERRAYAALAGIALSGPQAARGLIWPDTSDPASLVNSRPRPFAIVSTHAIHPVDSDRPACHVVWPTLIVPGRSTAITSLLGAERIDRTQGNARGQVAYLPFGPDAGPRDRLRIDHACNSPNGLADRDSADLGALLAIGVRSADAVAGGDDAATPSELEATLTVDGHRHALVIASDSSRAFSRSGVIALRLPERLAAAREFSIELRAPRGFACPPRVRQVGLNVMAIEQAVAVDHERHAASGRVDLMVELGQIADQTRLQTDGAATPLKVDVEAGAGATTRPWREVSRFDAAGPDDEVYRLDAERGRLHFGNGINGRVPPSGAGIFVSYSVCDGAAGNQLRPRAWFAAGLGPIGRNLDAMAGGSDAKTLQQSRAEARSAVRDRHALVTGKDIVDAALAQTALNVARAVVVAPAAGDLPGDITLVALRQRFAAGAGENEPARWLAALQGALQPQLPLGQRLAVRGPTYADFSLQATLPAAPLLDMADIRSAALADLAQRLDPITGGRSLGAALSAADLGAWLKRIDGVSAVATLVLRDGGKAVDSIDVGRHGLPRFDASNVMIDVVRGSARSRS